MTGQPVVFSHAEQNRTEQNRMHGDLMKVLNIIMKVLNIIILIRTFIASILERKSNLISDICRNQYSRKCHPCSAVCVFNLTLLVSPLAAGLVVCVFIITLLVSPKALGLEDTNQSSKSGEAVISLDDTVIEIQKLDMGRILNAQPMKTGQGVEWHRIKVLNDDGIVRVLEIDPNNPDTFNKLK